MTNEHSRKTKKGALKKLPFFISYLITDPIEYGNTVAVFEKSLTKALENHSVDMICFRDKTTVNIVPLATLFLQIARKFHIKKVLINSDISAALHLGFDGVHLTSQQFDQIEYAKQHNLYTIISCHTQEEIVQAKEKQSDAITYSPIFYKESKGTPKGCVQLSSMVKKYQDEKFKILALGGIVTAEQIAQVKETKCYGFASIRYFVG